MILGTWLIHEGPGRALRSCQLDPDTGHWPLRSPSPLNSDGTLPSTSSSSRAPFILPGGLFWADILSNGQESQGSPSVTPSNEVFQGLHPQDNSPDRPACPDSWGCAVTQSHRAGSPKSKCANSKGTQSSNRSLACLPTPKRPLPEWQKSSHQMENPLSPRWTGGHQHSMVQQG